VITKTSGKYFFANPRVWQETIDLGTPPELIGAWHGSYRLPASVTPAAVRLLAEGAPLPRVQANRTNGFDATITWHKSVSVLAYGLTPPAQGKEWARELLSIGKRSLQPLLDAQVLKTGAQGVHRTPSQGQAFLFNHWKNGWGRPHAHVHGFVPNLTSTTDGRVGSIGNAQAALYLRQGELKAAVNKRTDDLLQAKGYPTYRCGQAVAITGIPAAMLRELSPARAAMDRIRKHSRAGRARTTPRAEDFFARMARQEAPPQRRQVTPQVMHQETLAIAAKYGVSLASLRGAGSPSHRDPNESSFQAYQTVIQARDRCVHRFGAFTASQFREAVYTFGIGKPVTFAELDTLAAQVLKRPKLLGVRKLPRTDGTVRYFTQQTAPRVQAAEQAFTRDAWDELARAGKNLGAAVFVATARTVKDALDRVHQSLFPEPRRIQIDAARLDAFLQRHTPTGYWKAHAWGLLKMLTTRGTPHERAAAGERVYRHRRACQRLEPNSVLVIGRGNRATPRQLQALARIARRDQCVLILAERGAAAQTYARPTKPPRRERGAGRPRRDERAG
jgi:hypothetical protein